MEKQGQEGQVEQVEILGIGFFQKIARCGLHLQMRKLTQQHDIPLIVDDRLDVALAVEADGLEAQLREGRWLQRLQSLKLLDPNKKCSAREYKLI